MAKPIRNRVLPSALAADKAILVAVEGLPNYVPVIDELSVASIRELEAAMVESQRAFGQLNRDVVIAREGVIAAEHAYHQAVNRLKSQVKALFGEDAVALHAVGLKRRSERKPPARRSPQG